MGMMYDKKWCLMSQDWLLSLWILHLWTFSQYSNLGQNWLKGPLVRNVVCRHFAKLHTFFTMSTILYPCLIKKSHYCAFLVLILDLIYQLMTHFFSPALQFWTVVVCSTQRGWKKLIRVFLRKCSRISWNMFPWFNRFAVSRISPATENELKRNFFIYLTLVKLRY